MKQLREHTAFISTVSVLTIGWVGVSPGYTQPQFATPEDSLIQFVPPVLGDRNRPSDRARGGASRSSCREQETPTNLTALVPSTPDSLNETEITVESDLHGYELENTRLESLASVSDELDNQPLEAGELSRPETEEDDFVLSLTTETHPSFWFYVPYVLDEAVTLDFVFQDEIGNTLYRTQFTVDEESPGIVQFSLPDILPPLTVDHTYRWSFFHCDAASTNGPLHATGWIVRTTMDADFEAQLENASELEEASLYATNGIWQDALTTLGELYREDPQDTTLMQNWISLLTSAGLDEVSEQPLIDCCDSAQGNPSVD